jgi:hypothetical protein
VGQALGRSVCVGPVGVPGGVWFSRLASLSDVTGVGRGGGTGGRGAGGPGGGKWANLSARVCVWVLWECQEACGSVV